MTIRYRADIDGLRAVAVVAVMLFHFKVSGFSGGFVGVDVFFVISGFLIATLIGREIGEGRFSLLHFYERRIRRLFPALIVLLFAVSILSYVELFPLAYLRFGQSVTATSVFLSNVEFWREVDNYFGAASQTKPLLHTWSLAVEEQFYLLFPLLMMLLAMRPKRWTMVLLAIFIAVSLGFSIWSASASPGIAFFWGPSRAWELLLGVAIALGAFPVASSRPVNEVLAALGLAMIGCAIAMYTPRTAFPGVAALLPCVGAGLVIHAGLRDSPFVNRLLSTRQLVFIGLISYSLYLWHWPIYVFATYRLARVLSPIETACLIAASFAIAALSWKFAEQPFRRPGGVVSRRQVFLQAATAMSIFGVSGVAIYLAYGLPQRFTPEVQALLAPQTYFRRFRCEPGETEQTIAGPMCRIGRPGGPVTFLLWGDSQAEALGPAVALAANRRGHTGLMTTLGGCAPLIEAGSEYWVTARCRRHNDATLTFLQTREIDAVILSARWTAYAESGGFARSGEARELGLRESRRDFAHAFRSAVDVLRARGHRVVVIGQVPEISSDVPTTLARRRMSGLPEDIGPTLAEFEARDEAVLEQLAAVDGAVELVYPHLTLCSDGRCAVVREGKPLYFDNNHLDPFGAESISAIFEPIFRDKR